MLSTRSHVNWVNLSIQANCEEGATGQALQIIKDEGSGEAIEAEISCRQPVAFMFVVCCSKQSEIIQV
jgi:hypothetical protein